MCVAKSSVITPNWAIFGGGLGSLGCGLRFYFVYLCFVFVLFLISLLFYLFSYSLLIAFVYFILFVYLL